jgi:hypothetical protein
MMRIILVIMATASFGGEYNKGPKRYKDTRNNIDEKRRNNNAQFKASRNMDYIKL